MSTGGGENKNYVTILYQKYNCLMVMNLRYDVNKYVIVYAIKHTKKESTVYELCLIMTCFFDMFHDYK